MRQLWTASSALALTLLAHAGPAFPQDAPSYSMSVSVNEVSITFSAADANGLPINDLTLDEVHLLDNNHPPLKIIAFQSLHDLPIRTGILMDTSPSMNTTRAEDRAIAIKYSQELLRRQTDRAFVMNFDSIATVAQPWTSDPVALSAGIRNRAVVTNGIAHPSGTAIFDAIYRACLGQFSHIENQASGNFILLFSDGEDNASRTPLALAVDTCQHANTVIYAFRPNSASVSASGSKTLADLASQTGGQVFLDNQSDDAIDRDLHQIEATLRNQYRLVYKPPQLKRDGSFHRVELEASGRIASIVARSGYYAPAH